jgi:hypothetical protein
VNIREQEHNVAGWWLVDQLRIPEVLELNVGGYFKIGQANLPFTSSPIYHFNVLVHRISTFRQATESNMKRTIKIQN